MPDRKPSPWFLRPSDQFVVAAGALLGLVAMMGWWAWAGGWQGRLVEIEETPKRAVHFAVDINTAGEVELALLPEIGPALAGRIIESRRSEGPFRSPDDLLRVPGIGPKTLEAVRPYIAIPRCPAGDTP